MKVDKTAVICFSLVFVDSSSGNMQKIQISAGAGFRRTVMIGFFKLFINSTGKFLLYAKKKRDFSISQGQII